MSELRESSVSFVGGNLSDYIIRRRQESDIIDQYLVELVRTLQNIDQDAIWAVTNVLFHAWENGTKVFYDPGYEYQIEWRAPTINYEPYVVTVEVTDDAGLSTIAEFMPIYSE